MGKLIKNFIDDNDDDFAMCYIHMKPFQPRWNKFREQIDLKSVHPLWLWHKYLKLLMETLDFPLPHNHSSQILVYLRSYLFLCWNSAFLFSVFAFSNFHMI